MHYNLEQSTNYDKNAMDHRIVKQTLESSTVDTYVSDVDTSFKSVQLNVQANYAIGVFD